MSHFKERKSKSCLNCNAQVHNKYCGVCGQENIEPQESVFHLFKHFFEDITHFDGKFFTSLKYLLTKPGFLTREYVAGRRMSYLNPVRFYIFTSFLFFLIIFSLMGDFDKEINQNGDITIGATKDTISKIMEQQELKIDSNEIEKKGFLKGVKEGIKNSKNESKGLLAPLEFRDRKQFDSLDKLKKVNIGFWRRFYINKKFDQKEKYGDDKAALGKDVIKNLIHYIPQGLFLTLPFFALVLKLLYVRRKKFYYVAHIIFTIHFYIFVYINFLTINLLGELADLTKIEFFNNITIVLGFAIFYYMYLAMRNFYEQSRKKTILKLIILSFSFLFLFIFFLLFLIGFSFFKT